MSIRPRHRPPGGAPALLLALLLFGLAVVPTALAAPPDVALLRSLREQGRYEEALVRIRAALRAEPGNADLLLFEGQILTDLKRFAQAATVLGNAIRIAPDYADLHLARARALFFAGRREDALDALRPLLEVAAEDPRPWLLAARIHFAAGRLDRAEAALGRLRELAPEDPEALLTAADIARRRGHLRLASAYYERILEAPGYEQLVRRRLAGLEAERRRFRLTLSGSFSEYDDSDREPWREGSAELAWRWDERTWLRGRLDLRRRFGASDVGILLSLERRLAEATTLVLGLGGTPDADFSPHVEGLLGVSHRLRQGAGRLGDTVGSARLRLKKYPEGRVDSLELGITQYFLDARLWATAAVVQTRDEAGGRDLGLAARIDGIPRPGWRLFAGTSIERDEVEGGTTLARSVFAGFAVDLDDRLRVFFDLGLNDRSEGGLRRTLGLGLSLAF